MLRGAGTRRRSGRGWRYGRGLSWYGCKRRYRRRLSRCGRWRRDRPRVSGCGRGRRYGRGLRWYGCERRHGRRLNHHGCERRYGCRLSFYGRRHGRGPRCCGSRLSDGRRRSCDRHRRQCRCIDGGEPKSAATFLIEAPDPDKTGAAADPIYRQSFLGGASKVADEVDEKSLSRTLSFGQQLDAVVVERLELDLAPHGHYGIEGAKATRHFRYAWRFADLARVALDVAFRFIAVEECRLLAAVGIDNGSVLRVQDRILRLEGASPLLVTTRFLAPGDPVELLARTAFVLAVHRAFELDAGPQHDRLDRVSGLRTGNRIAGSDLSAGRSGKVQAHRQRDPRSIHGVRPALAPQRPQASISQFRLLSEDAEV